MDSGRLAEAIVCYSRALELDSTVADVWVDRGACRHGMGDHRGAIDDFRHALTILPLHTIAHFNLGIVYFTAHTPDSARAWWNRLLLISPTGPQADRARALLAQLDSLPGRPSGP
jgi:tetratricopeptide (TPR) repeat protein